MERRKLGPQTLFLEELGGCWRQSGVTPLLICFQGWLSPSPGTHVLGAEGNAKTMVSCVGWQLGLVPLEVPFSQ